MSTENEDPVTELALTRGVEAVGLLVGGGSPKSVSYSSGVKFGSVNASLSARHNDDSKLLG